MFVWCDPPIFIDLPVIVFIFLSVLTGQREPGSYEIVALKNNLLAQDFHNCYNNST